jgi:D-arabinose 1-dehydrogenase-like Zn-dependent alcohol dehydrogenase
VCHTDLHTVEGDLALPLLPIIPGHQVIGIVIPIRTTVRVFPLKAANEALLALKRSQIDGTAVLMTG